MQLGDWEKLALEISAKKAEWKKILAKFFAVTLLKLSGWKAYLAALIFRKKVLDPAEKEVKKEIIQKPKDNKVIDKIDNEISKPADQQDVDKIKEAGKELINGKPS